MARARTVKQLTDAAMQGTQFPCGTLADHDNQVWNEFFATRTPGERWPGHTCPECQSMRQAMDKAYTQGTHDATDRAGLYDLVTMRQEEQNAKQAYADIPATEPAVSYMVGYFSGINSARMQAEREAR